AITLLVLAAGSDPDAASSARVYRLGDWPAIFSIVLVLDRLAALMVLLSSLLGFAALIFALARWHRAGTHFHPLLQLQIMGLHGAFLTGDIFNLFVFFEVMLAASYGLALHGSGIARVRAGLHYITINLVTSFLILIGASVVYGIAGTLNMADLAIHIGSVPPGDRSLLEAGLAVLGIAFLVKAAIWPLGFWLPPYNRTTARSQSTRPSGSVCSSSARTPLSPVASPVHGFPIRAWPQSSSARSPSWRPSACHALQVRACSYPRARCWQRSAPD